jgi:hypothetical protein
MRCPLSSTCTSSWGTRCATAPLSPWASGGACRRARYHRAGADRPGHRGQQRPLRRGLHLEAADYDPRGSGPGSLPLAARTLNLAAAEGIEVVLAGAVRYADPDQAPSPTSWTQPAA